MDEDKEPEVGSRPPKRAQAWCIQWLTLNLGGNDDPREAQLDNATLEFGLCV
jgi:hypothetical protein